MQNGRPHLANIGHIITKQRSDFDSRTYGYTKFSDLVAATVLFELDRRTPREGKATVLYVRDKRHDESEAQWARAGG
ncbi:OST-HTH/LOTUS domain-containing protein [Streptomyces sp. NPDC091219]|uniref:OST-HTH/LOTUS domain-containing protein n=1 Tax=Streptomyces sp. NPDC091219 TaxID=3155193 RepID=UPI00344B9215